MRTDKRRKTINQKEASVILGVGRADIVKFLDKQGVQPLIWHSHARGFSRDYRLSDIERLKAQLEIQNSPAQNQAAVPAAIPEPKENIEARVTVQAQGNLLLSQQDYIAASIGRIEASLRILQTDLARLVHEFTAPQSQNS